MEKRFAIPTEISAKEIKRIRKELFLTQKEFAKLVGCSKPTIERWETSDKPITGPIVLLLYMIHKNPDEIEKLQIPEKKYPIRMWYMHENTPCTLIEIDELNQRIRIQNYVTNLLFRAFGVNESPSYEDYQEFLESRCFPRTRDKMKLILKDLNLPFYDPFLIVQKTQGRMAEDNFWIKFEK